jgi:hypothetical protein
MAQDLLLYSTNTFLAFKIAEQFYGNVHYVWCSPYFSFTSAPSFSFTNPPSSSPREIYERLYQDVTMGDKHSTKIMSNRTGIQNGATQKAAAGVITDKQKREIYSIANQADPQFFKPLLYIIPFSHVISLVQIVPVRRRANPLSKEYIIEELPRDCFDVVEYRPV